MTVEISTRVLASLSLVSAPSTPSIFVFSTVPSYFGCFDSKSWARRLASQFVGSSPRGKISAFTEVLHTKFAVNKAIHVGSEASLAVPLLRRG